ncbi:hypothetical protein C5167_021431, partial [Papaver somniferum]
QPWRPYACDFDVWQKPLILPPSSSRILITTTLQPDLKILNLLFQLFLTFTCLFTISGEKISSSVFFKIPLHHFHHHKNWYPPSPTPSSSYPTTIITTRSSLTKVTINSRLEKLSGTAVHLFNEKNFKSAKPFGNRKDTRMQLEMNHYAIGSTSGRAKLLVWAIQVCNEALQHMDNIYLDLWKKYSDRSITLYDLRLSVRKLIMKLFLAK